jgi:hypothetical protein
MKNVFGNFLKVFRKIYEKYVLKTLKVSRKIHEKYVQFFKFLFKKIFED